MNRVFNLHADWYESCLSSAVFIIVAALCSDTTLHGLTPARCIATVRLSSEALVFDSPLPTILLEQVSEVMP